MSIPLAGELAQARADRQLLMDKSVQVQANTPVHRPGGGAAEGTWATVPGGTLLCNKYRVRSATEEALVAGVATPKSLYNIYLPYTEAVLALGINASHRLLIDGELLEIAQAPKPGSTDLAIHLLASGR